MLTPAAHFTSWAAFHSFENPSAGEGVLPVSARRANLLGDCDHGIGARRDAALAIGGRETPLADARPLAAA